jgi:hypothetical protein
LDETVQRISMIIIPQEFQQAVLFGKRFQIFEDTHQSPTDIQSERDANELREWGYTNPQSSSLRVRSE